MSETGDLSGHEAPSPRDRRGIGITIAGCPDGMDEPIRRAVTRALASRGLHDGQLEVAVVGDAEMRRQHARWMDDDTTTDALTFDLRDDPSDACVDGQLIVCKSLAKRRAKSRGHNWQAELLLYVVHGCLHLCGFDDQSQENAAEMHKLEDRILTELGWGPVFYSGTGVERAPHDTSDSRHGDNG